MRGTVREIETVQRRAQVVAVQRRALAADVWQPHRHVVRIDRCIVRHRRRASVHAQLRNKPARIGRSADEQLASGAVCGIVHSPGFSIHSSPITAHVMSVVPQITSTSPRLVRAGDDLLAHRVDRSAAEQRTVCGRRRDRPARRRRRSPATAPASTPASAESSGIPAGAVEQRVRRERGRGVERGAAATARGWPSPAPARSARRQGSCARNHAQEAEQLTALGRIGAVARPARRPRWSPYSSPGPAAEPSAVSAPSDGTIAATFTAATSSRGSRRHTRGGRLAPRRVDVVFERVRVGNEDRVRHPHVDATTLPSPSAAMALTDVVPMSMPTVVSMAMASFLPPET